jgi:hypothetical protein
VGNELRLIGCGHSVTIRADSAFVRANSGWVEPRRAKCPNRAEWLSGFVRAPGISKRGLDLLRLSSLLIDLRFVVM